jgi:hypothetical protein
MGQGLWVPISADQSRPPKVHGEYSRILSCRTRGEMSVLGIWDLVIWMRAFRRFFSADTDIAEYHEGRILVPPADLMEVLAPLYRL